MFLAQGAGRDDVPSMISGVTITLMANFQAIQVLFHIL